MLCKHWATGVCPAGFPVGTFSSLIKYACIVTVQIQTYCNRWMADQAFAARPGDRLKVLIRLSLPALELFLFTVYEAI